MWGCFYILVFYIIENMTWPMCVDVYIFVCCTHMCVDLSRDKAFLG